MAYGKRWKMAQGMVDGISLGFGCILCLLSPEEGKNAGRDCKWLGNRRKNVAMVSSV